VGTFFAAVICAVLLLFLGDDYSDFVNHELGIVPRADAALRGLCKAVGF
jgi:hypothetical protein